MCLPVSTGASEPVAVPKERRAKAGRAPLGTVRGRRVLVVEDNADARDALKFLLEEDGHDVRTAGDGPGAIEEARDFQPEVVLLDIGLPGMNGFEVANRLRGQPECRDALLIALTGYGEAESRNRSAAAGFDFHMVKPADVDLLLTMIANPQEARRTRAAA